MARLKSGSPLIYSNDLGSIIGIRDPDGDEFYFNQQASIVGSGKVGGDTVANLVDLVPSTDGVYYNAASYYNGYGASASGAQGGGTFVWSSTTPKSQHNGGTIISPTVPWDGSTAGLANFLNRVGETLPAATGCWLRVDTKKITPELFGAVGNGVVNDQPACQAALSSIANKGGGKVVAAKRYYIATDLIISFNCALEGEMGFMGHGQNSVGPLPYNFSFDTVSSIFIIAPTASIVLRNSSAVRSLTCLASGLQYPFTDSAHAQAQVDAFAGKAIRTDTTTGVDFQARDCQIEHVVGFGFEYLIYAVKCPRIWITDVKFDCVNGIYIETAADFSKISNCHGWPFLTANANVDQVLLRRNAETAYFSDSAYVVYQNCTQVGWKTGFATLDCAITNFDNCRNDTGPNQRRTFAFAFGSDVYVILPNQTELIDTRTFIDFSGYGSGTLINPDGFYTFERQEGSSGEFITVDAVTPRTPVLSNATYKKLTGRTLLVTATAHGAAVGSYIYTKFASGAEKFVKTILRDFTANTFRVTYPESEQAFFDALPGNANTNTSFQYEVQITNKALVKAPSFSGTYSRVDSAFSITVPGGHSVQVGEQFGGYFFIGSTFYYKLFTVTAVTDIFTLSATPTDFAVAGTDSGEFYLEPMNKIAFDIRGNCVFPSVTNATAVGYFTAVNVDITNNSRESVIISTSCFTSGRVRLRNGNVVLTGNQFKGNGNLFAAVVHEDNGEATSTDSVMAVGNLFDLYKQAFEIATSRLPNAVIGTNKYIECPVGTIDSRNNTVTGANGSSVVAGRDNTVSGQSAFASGELNQATGLYSAAIGATCIASGQSSFAQGGVCTASGIRSVAHGQNSVASGTNSSVLGGNGNNVTATGSSIGAGASNVIPAGNNSFIGGGSGNSSSSPQGFIGGGTNNVIGTSSNNSNIVGGTTNTLSGTNAAIGGGSTNSALGTNTTIPGGAFATTNNIIGQMACGFNGAVLGKNQETKTGLRRTTTNATAAVATANGGTAAATNQLTLRDNTTFRVRGFAVARSATDGASKEWEIKALVKRGSGAATVTVVGSNVTSTYADAGAATWAVTVGADTTNGSFQVNVQGRGSTTVEWTVVLTAEEVSA